MPDGSSRFDRCRCVLAAAPEGAADGTPPTPIRYRRCPVGVIADVDCPEYAGARCNHFVDRGPQAPSVVPRTEVPLLAIELATDYLTPRYRRRIAALRDGALASAGTAWGPLPGAPPSSASAPSFSSTPPSTRSSTLSSIAGLPINVPADRVG